MSRSRTLATLLCAGLLLLAGCTAPETTDLGDAQAVGNATVAPGTTAHLPLLLGGANGTDGPTPVTVTDAAGLDVQAPDELTANETGALAGWVGFVVPEDAAPGVHNVTLEVGEGEAARSVAFSITVQEAQETLSEGTIARVNIAARTAGGELAFTTQEHLDASALPRAPGYQAPRSFQPAPLQLAAQSQLPASLVNALTNASVNQSMTVEVPDAFGPETLEQEQAREETIPRVAEQQRFLQAPRQLAAQQGLVNSSSQVGDAVQLGGAGGLPYVITELNESQVRLGLDLEEGDNITQYPAWPGATQVAEVANQTVTLRTTPDLEEGEMFTWNEQWPEATEIVAMDETNITIRHSPEEGTSYTQTNRQGQTITVTVADVGPDAITLSQENPHPLGGETLFFEVTVVGEQPAPQQPAMGQP